MSRYRQWLGGLTVGALSRRVWVRAREIDFFTRAAAAAYYALIALVPFLGVVVSLAANVMPLTRVNSHSSVTVTRESLTGTQDLIERLVPAEAVPMIDLELARLREAPPFKLVSLGLVLSLWFSSGVFGVLIDALNRIQGVPETRPAWFVMIIAMALTLLEAVIMIGSLALLVVWPAIRGSLGVGEGSSSVGTSWEWICVTLGALSSFAVIARVGPSSPNRWRWITPGSVFCAFAFLAAAILMRIYLAHWGNYAATYGSLAVVMVLTTWFWIVAFIVLLAFQIDKTIDSSREERSCTRS